jgi:cysteine desulfurase
MNETAEPIYLDHGATTPVRAEVRDAMLPWLGECWGNASSVHRWGRQARAALEDARARLAAVIGARPSEIYFTRGGTEADNLAVLGCGRAAPGATIACSAFEHRAVLSTAQAAERQGARLLLIPVTSDGLVETETLDGIVAERPCLVSVMWANNEVGTVQPIQAIAEKCRAAGVVFHTDAIQALGKLRVRVDETPVDVLSLSAHKLYGPKGVGAVYVRRGTAVEPLIHGGGQERGMRPGTEDVAGAVAFAVAAELAESEREAEMPRVGALRDRLEAGLRERVPGLVVNGVGAPRLPTVSNVSVPGADAEMLLMALDTAGIAVSSGSACSSGVVKASHVLTAMGLPPELAVPSVRFSLGRSTTAAQIEEVIRRVPAVFERLRPALAAGAQPVA